jgi:hypothetical protein
MNAENGFIEPEIRDRIIKKRITEIRKHLMAKFKMDMSGISPEGRATLQKEFECQFHEAIKKEGLQDVEYDPHCLY